MHRSLRLLDEAASLAVREIRALAAEDEGDLQALCDRRAALIEQAWEDRAGCDPVLLGEALNAILHLQESLSAQARFRSMDLQDLLRDSRQESTRVNGYKRVTTQRPGEALYLSRQS